MRNHHGIAPIAVQVDLADAIVHHTVFDQGHQARARGAHRQAVADVVAQLPARAPVGSAVGPGALEIEPMSPQALVRV